MISHPQFDTEGQRERKSKRGDALQSERQGAGTQVWVSIQGQRVTVQETHCRNVDSESVPRGPIVTFSDRARGRMIRRICEVDWSKAGSVLFVTVTYPPEAESHTMQDRSRHRAVFNRYVERHLGGRVGSVWRIEWKERLSGETKGQLAPHIHNLYFGVRFVSKRWIAEHWRKSVGCKTTPVVDVQRCDTYRKVSIYLAKYCSKAADSRLLDCVPKRNRTGRHAGWLRKKEIPWHPLRVFRVIEQEVMDFLKQRATETIPWFDPRFDVGFSAFGDIALELADDLGRFILDGGLVPV